MKVKNYIVLVLCYGYSLNLNATDKTNLTQRTICDWLTDSSNISLFEPLQIISNTDISNWTYPINYMLKKKERRNILFYNQKIRGITAYYIDSLRSFYFLYIYTNEKSSKVILDSLQNALNEPLDPGGIIINNKKIRIGNVTSWIDSNCREMSIRYFPKEEYPYNASTEKGYKFKYFDWSNYIEINNWQLMPADFYNNKTWSQIEYEKNKLAKDKEFWKKQHKKWNRIKLKSWIKKGRVI